MLRNKSLFKSFCEKILYSFLKDHEKIRSRSKPQKQIPQHFSETIETQK